MASFAASSATFTSRLPHTPVKSGRYLMLPNPEQPAFLIPMHSRRAFRTGLGLIKPITRKGELKRNVLGLVPRWVLRLKFKTIQIEGGGSDRYSVILPWSQDAGSKFTCIHYDLRQARVEVQKFAFSPETREMVRNEHSYLQRLQVNGVSRIVIPEVRGFEDTEHYTVLTQPFYFGHYVEAIPSGILEFFSQLATREIHTLQQHPYMRERYQEVMAFLDEAGCETLKIELLRLYDQHRETRFQVATMHGDFSTTNTVQTPDNRYVLLDWEDAQEQGLNLDVPFFEFRRQLYKSGEWQIQGAEGFLVVFHYVWFQVVKRNRDMLRDFRIEHGRFYSAFSRG